MNRKIKVSHEVPQCILDETTKLMDVQFCLPHLMDLDEDYKNHFISCRDKGIEIYLDNSLHELGYAYDSDRLLYWINELKPTNFFIPDVWQDKTQSVINAKQWATIELPKETTKVAVVQAKTIHEAFVCVQTYKDLGYKKIAFSYGNQLYSDMCPHPNLDLAKALGRIQLISLLYKQKILTRTDRVHLLGCSVPGEMYWYKDIPCIESVDTSNPVMATLDGIKYEHDGLHNKPKSCMNDNFNTPKDEIDMGLLKYNITKFKWYLPY